MPCSCAVTPHRDDGRATSRRTVSAATPPVIRAASALVVGAASWSGLTTSVSMLGGEELAVGDEGGAQGIRVLDDAVVDEAKRPSGSA